MAPNQTPGMFSPVSPATHGPATHSFAVTPDGTMHVTRHAPPAAVPAVAPKAVPAKPATKPAAPKKK